MTSILLVDDHKLLRDCIRILIETSPHFKVIAEADNGLAAVRLCKEFQPDVALLDISMPIMDGIEATGEMRRHSPKTKVAILSAFDDEVHVMSAIRAGAHAYISKSASAVELLAALEVVAQGGSYLSTNASAHLVSRLRTTNPKTATSIDKLSPREQQVLRLISKGLESKEIAALLDVGLHTIRSYRKALMKKLGATNVAGLINAGLAVTDYSCSPAPPVVAKE